MRKLNLLFYGFHCDNTFMKVQIFKCVHSVVKSCLFNFQGKVVSENQHILPTYIPTPKQDPSSSESNFHNGAYINRIHQFSMPGR